MGTGLDATLGIGVEDTYGTYKAPFDFFEVESIGVKRTQNYLQSRPLRGRPGVPVSRHKETTRGAEGPISMEIPNSGFGILLWMLHGNAAAPVQQDGTAYLQTHEYGVTSPNGKSLTIQANKPSVEGDEAFTYLGCKVSQMAFSCDESQQLKATLDIMAADAVTNESLETPSYPDPITSRDFTEASVTIDGTDVDSSGIIIRSFNLTLPVPMHGDRFGLGTGGVQSEPIAFNDSAVPTVELDAEFSNSDLYDFYVADSEVPVVITFTGPVITGSENEKIAFSLPAAKFVGEDPEVSGPDVLSQSASLEVYDNLTNPPVTITYESTDTTLGLDGS